MKRLATILSMNLVLLLTMLVTGCATQAVTFPDNFNGLRPASILIVPPLNEVTDVQASTSVLATLPYYLAEKGFYVFPVNTVKTLLEFEGYYEAAEVFAAPPEQLANLFKADAILYVTIHQWTSKYVVFTASTEVDFEYRLVAADGSLLWRQRLSAVYSPNNNSGGGLAGLVVNAVQAAVERSVPNYIPLTKSLHTRAFLAPQGNRQSFPLGPYHPYYAEYYEQVMPVL